MEIETTSASLILAAQEVMIFVLRRWNILIQGVVILVGGFKDNCCVPTFYRNLSPTLYPFHVLAW